MVLGSKRFTTLSQIDSIQLGPECIPKSEYAVNLGVTMDNELNMCEHISSICKRCYQGLRMISRIRRYFDKDSMKTLVQCLIVSRIDYGNVLLYGVNSKELSKLQRVLNAAARVISGS